MLNDCKRSDLQYVWHLKIICGKGKRNPIMQSVSSFISKFTKTTCHIQIKFITDYYLQWHKTLQHLHEIQTHTNINNHIYNYKSYLKCQARYSLGRLKLFLRFGSNKIISDISLSCLQSFFLGINCCTIKAKDCYLNLIIIVDNSEGHTNIKLSGKLYLLSIAISWQHFQVGYFVWNIAIGGLNVDWLHALWHSKWGPGKSMYTFSTKRLPLSAPRKASVGRASRRWGGSWKRKMFSGKRIRWFTMTLQNV